jgi:hypothetical protein
MARGPCPLRSGLCLGLLASPRLKNFLLTRGTWQEQTVGLLITGCWAVWLHVWYPWLLFITSFILRDAATQGPCFITLAVPNQFRYPVLGQEPGCLNWHTHNRLLTEWRIFSPAYYYAEGTHGCAVKCCIISAVLWLNFLQTSLLFISTYQTFIEIIIPSRVYQWGVFVSTMCWEKHNITLRPMMTYIYSCGNGMQSVIFFSNHLSVTVHNLNLNVKQAWKNPCTIGILSHKDSWCLITFSSIISCDHPQRVSLVASIRTRVPYVS